MFHRALGPCLPRPLLPEGSSSRQAFSKASGYALGTSARHRRRASALVSGASGFMIARRWRETAIETAAVLVFCAGHSFTTSSRKNCGDRHTRVSRNRGHNPTGATRSSGTNRTSNSFSSASGTGICSSGRRSHLIAVIRTRQLRTLLSTLSAIDAGTSPESATGSISTPRFDPEGPGGDCTSLPTSVLERAKAILSASFKSDMAATARSSRRRIHLSVSSRSQYFFRSTSLFPTSTTYGAGGTLYHKI